MAVTVLDVLDALRQAELGIAIPATCQVGTTGDRRNLWGVDLNSVLKTINYHLNLANGEIHIGNETTGYPTKAIPTGQSGIEVVAAPGSLVIKINPTAPVSFNGKQVTEINMQCLATADRPTGLGSGDKGRFYFDLTLMKPMLWSGTAWVDFATGANTTNATALQGKDIATTSPVNGNALLFDSTLNKWKPGTPTANSNATSIRGKNVSPATPTVGQSWVFDGSSWVPQLIVPTSGNATSLAGLPIIGTPAVGQIPVYNGTGLVFGDIISVDGNATTIAGFPVNTSTPGTGQAYVFDGSTFAPQTVITEADALKIQGRDVSSEAPNIGDVITWDGTIWSYAAPSGGGGGGGGDANATSIVGYNVQEPTGPVNGSVVMFQNGNFIISQPIQPGMATNLGVNGSFDVISKGRSFNLFSDGSFHSVPFAPRWFVRQNGDCSGTVNIVDVNISNENNTFEGKASRYLELAVSLGGDTFSDGFGLCWLLDSIGWSHQKTSNNITISFLAKADATSLVNGILQNEEGGGTSANVSQTITTSWARKSFTFNAFQLRKGMCFKMRPNNTGTMFGRTTTIQMTEFQVEFNTQFSNYNKPTYDMERLACERWFHSSYADNALGTNTMNGAKYFTASKAGAISQYAGPIDFGVRMGGTPSVTIYNPASGDNQIRNISKGTDAGPASVSNVNMNGFIPSFGGASDLEVGDLCAYHYVADCEAALYDLY